jgi:hypothetical protein
MELVSSVRVGLRCLRLRAGECSRGMMERRGLFGGGRRALMTTEVIGVLE